MLSLSVRNWLLVRKCWAACPLSEAVRPSEGQPSWAVQLVGLTISSHTVSASRTPRVLFECSWGNTWGTIL